jgi:hypothetical protein
VAGVGVSPARANAGDRWPGSTAMVRVGDFSARNLSSLGSLQDLSLRDAYFPAGRCASFFRSLPQLHTVAFTRERSSQRERYLELCSNLPLSLRNLYVEGDRVAGSAAACFSRIAELKSLQALTWTPALKLKRDWFESCVSNLPPSLRELDLTSADGNVFLEKQDVPHRHSATNWRLPSLRWMRLDVLTAVDFEEFFVADIRQACKRRAPSWTLT